MWWNPYVGIPFTEKGRDLAGFDCWGLVRWVYRHDHPAGVLLPSYVELYEDTQQRDALGVLIAGESKTVWKPVEAKHASFDVVICRMRGVPMHVGLVTRPGYMLHCARGVGTVHERYDTMKWRDNIDGVVRYVGEGTDRLCVPATVQQ